MRLDVFGATMRVNKTETCRGVVAVSRGVQVMTCTRCIYDEKVSEISFDNEGVCNYCRQVDSLVSSYGTGTARGELKFRKLVEKIKLVQQNADYDCIVGVSGGTDSSFLLLLAKEVGLRPLAVHYDNTWNSAVATQNIAIVTKKLGIDLVTYVIDNKEQDQTKLAILKAGVPEFDADTDIAFISVLRKVAAYHRVKYILEGHSFVTEGISPIGGNYFDNAYVMDICRRFGDFKPKSFPSLGFWTFLKWSVIYRQQIIRPLWYLEYDKTSARKRLQEELGWRYYGGHHLENRASAFAHTVWLPQRFGVDLRNLSLAADVRSGKRTREEAIREYGTPVHVEKNLVRYVKKRLDLTDDEYLLLMNGPRRTWRQFKTYKRRFELLRPLFYVLARFGMVPMSFYLKYCFPLRKHS